ncbi:MAG: hypothetical protein Q8P50_04285 [Bacillota bacterium]|nr:hypothetical protein [Bacillota bacterium]
MRSWVLEHRNLVLVGLAVAIVAGFLGYFKPQKAETWQVWTVLSQDIRPQEPNTPIGERFRNPLGFAVDSKGSLVVIDEQGRSLVSYSPDGKSRSVTKLGQDAPLPLRIEVDETGLVYGIDNDRKVVTRYNNDGSTLPVFSQAAGEAYFIESIGVFGSGTLYVQDVTFERDRYTRKLIRVSPGGQIVTTLSQVEKSKGGDSRTGEKTQLPFEVDDFVVGHDGTLVVASGSPDPYSRDITRVAPSGKTARFTIREKQFIRSCRVLGIDSHGDILFGLALGRQPVVTCVKYTSSGQRISEFTLKGVTGTGEVTGRVDQAGNLYISRVSESARCIDKYSPKSEVKWVPRALADK